MVQQISLQQLRQAIPDKCFRPSTFRSLVHIVLDLILAGSLALAAFTQIPRLDLWTLRWALWTAYGYVQGLIFTGIWILGHECGHGALFPSKKVNDCFGFLLHSVLLVPYFAWKYTHARHHRFTNHVDKDTAFVPSQEGEKTWSKRIGDSLHHAEDAPLYSAVLLVMHQLFGWQAYIITYASGGENSTPRPPNGNLWDRNSLNPSACMFTKQQRFYVGLSTLGLMVVIAALRVLSSHIGSTSVVLLYLVPYLWMNNWLVAITYLHHTHRNIPHFDGSRWNYVDGALGTVDRKMPYVIRHLFHGIIDFHVVHHLFTQIPFYHAEEATIAIRKELGERYYVDETPFWLALWQTFRSCKVVIPSAHQSGVLVWK